MTNGRSDDGSIADLPWASVFDPAANARALGAIQARGFRAASEIVDRLVRATDRNGGGPADGAEPAAARPNGNGREISGSDVDRILGSWEKLVAQLTRGLRDAPMTRGGVATLDMGNSQQTSLVYLEMAGRGKTTTEVWLHNGGPEDMGDVRLRCSDLLSHDGSAIDSTAICFEPDVVPMSARSSRGVMVEIVVPQGVNDGTYRGTVLVNGHADVWMPIVLTVSSPPS